ncbi:APC family permease [Actinoplanes sp. NPDC026619]|uniref:APC family permease n=1 Tax=Actinoplanes sp. NPDC026619 TaxID=3155798 RepID=UPI0033FAB2E3
MTALAAAPISNVRTGLAKDRLGVVAVTAQVIAAAAPLTVIAGGATAGLAIAQQRGMAIAYIAVAVILGIFALPYVTMARQLPNAGAFYVYVTAGLGRVAGAATAFVAILSYNAMQIGLYGGLGYEAHNVLARYLHVNAPWWACALVGWLLVGIAGLLRVDFSARLLAWLLIGEIVVSAAFAGVQVAHPYQGHVSFEVLSPSWLLIGSAGVMLTIAIAGFVGFENTTVFSEEARNARRTVPLATFIAIALIGTLYGFCVWAMSVNTGADNIVAQAGEQGTNLIFKLSEPFLPTFIVTIGHFLFVTSLFAANLSFHNTSNRYFYAMGRDGLLPAVFGRTSQRTKSPVAASLLQSALALVVISVYAITGWDPYVKLFFWLTASAGLGVLTLMVLTSLAMLVYFWRQRSHRRRAAEIADTVRGIPDPDAPARHTVEPISAWRGLVAPVVAGILLTIILWQTVANMHQLLGVAPTDNLRWYFPAAIPAFMLLGVVVALVLKTVRPDAYERIGNGVARRPRGGAR